MRWRISLARLSQKIGQNKKNGKNLEHEPSLDLLLRRARELRARGDHQTAAYYDHAVKQVRIDAMASKLRKLTKSAEVCTDPSAGASGERFSVY
jgi:hypothetical protein